MDGITVKAQNWLLKTRETRWTQAEILQVMEEIERVSLNSLMVYLGARRHTMLGYDALLNLTQARLPFPANLAAVNSALCDVDGLVENDIAAAILAMADLVKADTSTLAWLKQNDLTGWRDALPNRDLSEALSDFLAQYGHRCAVEGEIMTPRWASDPTPVLHAVLACATREPKHPAKVPAAQYVNKLAATGGRRRPKDGRGRAATNPARAAFTESCAAHGGLLSGRHAPLGAGRRPRGHDGRSPGPRRRRLLL
ncbi:MAG: hypothetical protein H6644_11805 [Caldilineaceae bacterium]|nr:hypothetical protein [Caldilineaceae bacterium]